LETLLTIQNNFSFKKNKDSTSKLVTKILTSSGGGIEEKIVKTSWNNFFLAQGQEC
jgi:hypothetical protein